MPKHYQDSNLITKGSVLSVIRWANNLLPPPHNFVEIFKEMCTMLEETNYVVQYVYEEENIRANELVNSFYKWSISKERNN